MIRAASRLLVTGPLLESLGFVRTGSDLYPPTGLMHASYRLERG